jgi:hypothetical protein
MARLKDLLNEKGEFYEKPLIIQCIEPADYVAEQILEHLRYGYQLMSMTPISAGPHSGRMLLLFQQAQAGRQY